MSDPKPPSIGSTRCQIYRFQRVLEDGCVGCGLSVTACAATRDVERRECCDTCRHDGV